MNRISMEITHRPIPSEWGSCLKKTEEFLEFHPILVDVLEAESSLDWCRNLVDGALVCFVPEAQKEVFDYYKKRNSL